MILFKACSKCHGDLWVVEDKDGKYVSCAQCGFLKDLSQVQAPGGEGDILGEKKEKVLKRGAA